MNWKFFKGVVVGSAMSVALWLGFWLLILAIAGARK